MYVPVQLLLQLVQDCCCRAVKLGIYRLLAVMPGKISEKGFGGSVPKLLPERECCQCLKGARFTAVLVLQAEF